MSAVKDDKDKPLREGVKHRVTFKDRFNLSGTIENNGNDHIYNVGDTVTAVIKVGQFSSDANWLNAVSISGVDIEDLTFNPEIPTYLPVVDTGDPEKAKTITISWEAKSAELNQQISVTATAGKRDADNKDLSNITINNRHIGDITVNDLTPPKPSPPTLSYVKTGNRYKAQKIQRIHGIYPVLI